MEKKHITLYFEKCCFCHKDCRSTLSSFNKRKQKQTMLSDHGWKFINHHQAKKSLINHLNIETFTRKILVFIKHQTKKLNRRKEKE